MSQEQPTKSNIALSFDNLIGGPIAAIVSAQQYSSQATLKYLLALTEKDEKTKQLRPKNMEFVADRTVFGKDGKSSTQNQKIKIPILSLVPPPCINIDEAEINFSANIVHHKQALKQKNILDNPESNIPKLYATYSESKSASSHINVKIKIKQQQAMGFEKAQSFLNQSIVISEENV